MAAATAVEASDAGRVREEVRSFLELFALCGIAIVQPLLDSLRRNSLDTFVASGATAAQVVLLVVAILVVPPAVLWLIEAAVRLASAAARRVVHATFAGALAGLVVVTFLVHQTDLGTVVRFALALPVAVGAGLLVARVPGVRLFLRYLAFAPLLFALMFLTNDQVSPIVLSTAGGTDADVTVGRPNRVVMIVLDELPLQSLLDGTGKIDAQLYPNFAALAGDSTWYRNATTVAPYTTAAVPALLTGDLPTSPDALPTASEHPDSLFTLLGRTYDLNTHEHLESLNPRGETDRRESLGWMVDRSFTLWRNLVVPKRAEGWSVLSQHLAGESIEMQQPAVDAFVDSLQPSTKPQLDYVHLLLPHVPWHLLPDGRTYGAADSLPGVGAVWSDQALADVAYQRYLLQLQATDRALGEIVSRLKDIDAYDDALLIVTADHGEAFTAGAPLRKATAANYSEIMWVPLLVKAPGQDAGAVDDRPASSVDVLPTIASILDVDLPWDVDGRSLLGKPRRDGDRPLLRMPAGFMASPSHDLEFEQWDGPKGFARVLDTQLLPPGDDASLRVYRGFSDFGALVGRPAAPLLTDDASSRTGTIDNASDYEAVDPDAEALPWTYLRGTIDGPPGRDVAIILNGTVASVVKSAPNPYTGGASYFALLPPQLFVAGRNDVGVALVTGTPEAPRLAPITLEER